MTGRGLGGGDDFHSVGSNPVRSQVGFQRLAREEGVAPPGEGSPVHGHGQGSEGVVGDQEGTVRTIEGSIGKGGPSMILSTVNGDVRLERGS